MRQLLRPKRNGHSYSGGVIDATAFIPLVFLPGGQTVYTDPSRIATRQPIGRTNDGAVAYLIIETDGTQFRAVDEYGIWN